MVEAASRAEEAAGVAAAFAAFETGAVRAGAAAAAALGVVAVEASVVFATVGVIVEWVVLAMVDRSRRIFSRRDDSSDHSSDMLVETFFLLFPKIEIWTSVQC